MDNYIKFNDKTILKIGDPNKRHIILNSDYAKKYMGYLLIIEDLKSVLEALDKLKTDIVENIILESLSFYIVIIYGKAFSKVDVRRVKLEKGQLKNLREDLQILHDILIDIRDKHVAHAGSEIFSLTHLLAQYNQEDDKTLNIFLSGLSLSSFNFNINSIQELVKEVLKICEIQKEKSYKILNKNMISKEDADKMSFLPKDYRLFSFEEIQYTLINLNQQYYEN